MVPLKIRDYHGRGHPHQLSMPVIQMDETAENDVFSESDQIVPGSEPGPATAKEVGRTGVLFHTGIKVRAEERVSFRSN